MSSQFAQRFHAKARPLLWKSHGETVRYITATGERDLVVTWKRVSPENQDPGEGLGLDPFFASAQAVVQIADLPEPDGQAHIVRAEERWVLRRVERQDAWTWIFHLEQPHPETRLPARMRG